LPQCAAVACRGTAPACVYDSRQPRLVRRAHCIPQGVLPAALDRGLADATVAQLLRAQAATPLVAVGGRHSTRDRYRQATDRLLRLLCGRARTGRSADFMHSDLELD